jgi:hypothetical protein
MFLKNKAGPTRLWLQLCVEAVESQAVMPKDASDQVDDDIGSGCQASSSQQRHCNTSPSSHILCHLCIITTCVSSRLNTQSGAQRITRVCLLL